MRTLRNTRTGQIIQVEDNEVPNFNVAAPVTQQPTPTPRRESLLASLLPLLGGIAGSALGTPFGPAGIIAGGAIGSGLGETGRQGISGENIQGGKIAGEAALGGLGGGLGVLLGGGLKTAKAGKAILKASTAKAGAEEGVNLLTKAGKSIREGVVTPKLKTVKPTFAKEMKEISKFTTGRYKGSAAQQAAQLSDDYIKTSQGIKTIADESAAKLNLKKILSEAKSSASREVDLKSGIGKKNLDFWTKRLKEVKTPGEALELKYEIQGKLPYTDKPLTPQQAVLQSIHDALDVELKTKVKEISAPLKSLNMMWKAAPGLNRSASENYTMWGAKIPKSGTQAVRDFAGRAVEGTGNVLERYRTPLSLTGGQATPRLLGGLTEDGSMPTSEASPVNDYSQPQQENSLGLTAEKVALARLILPKEQADRIEAAYKLLGGDTKDKTDTQIARDEVSFLVEDALGQLATGSVKTGPISPRVEGFKSVFNAGDPETINFNTTISALTAAIAKARAGTSFTASEKQLLEQYSPKVGDSTQQLMQKLSVLRRIRSNSQ